MATRLSGDPGNPAGDGRTSSFDGETLEDAVSTGIELRVLDAHGGRIRFRAVRIRGR